MFIDQLAIFGFIAPKERNVYRPYFAPPELELVWIGGAINILLLWSLTRLVVASAAL
jgi:hypothetical protein